MVGTIFCFKIIIFIAFSFPELHGSGYVVKCLSCRYRVSRFQFQNLLKELNCELTDDSNINRTPLRPDGDIDVDPRFVTEFKYPNCPHCNGLLKPDIIFFGDSVPKERVQKVFELLKISDRLLILGSSLFVYSGYRFAVSALETRKPIAIVNIGPTRIDKFPGLLKIERRVGEILPLISVF